MCQNLCQNLIWLVVWNIVYFPYIGNFINPTDERILFRGVGKPPASIYIYIDGQVPRFAVLPIRNYAKSPVIFGKHHHVCWLKHHRYH